MVRAIVGANWGDEGKGKITDLLAADSDIVIRFQGGSNAGHTIINPYGKFALHLLPSGVFQEHTVSLIGPGVAFNIPYFLKEINSLVEKGVPKPNIFVSERVQLLLPYHILFDKYEEERLGKHSFGSTKSGIAPFYSDKYAKMGIQLNELYQDEQRLYDRLERILAIKNCLLKNLYGKETLNAREVLDELLSYKEVMRPYVLDTTAFLHEALAQDKKILLEGQLGALRDPDHGIYPMVTSSSTLAGYGTIGAGIPPSAITEIIAVVKAYSSAVGEGAFVTEIFGEEAQELRMRGGDKGEFGATTGRPRRMGWFDAVASRYGCRVQGATDVVFSIVDALGYLDEIPMCVAYELDGKEMYDFPITADLHRCRPVYKIFPGWKSDIRGIRTYEELPKLCREYIEAAERELGVPIRYIGNGPDREDIIYRKEYECLKD